MGIVDPLEGSVVILTGSLLIFLSAYLLGDRYRRLFLIAFAMIVSGVFFLFLFSLMGGFGGKSSLPWALISLLECFEYDQAPQIFWNKGLWIPYRIQVELQETLKDEFAADRTAHNIDYEKFLSIFDHVSSFPRSLDLYLDQFFPLKDISRRAIQKLLNKHSPIEKDFTEKLLQRFSYELFRREIVPYRNLFSVTFLKLKDFLISKGRLESPERQAPLIDKVQMNARKLFGYNSNEKIVVKELKKTLQKLNEITPP